jgi:hypothetical protein
MNVPHYGGTGFPVEPVHAFRPFTFAFVRLPQLLYRIAVTGVTVEGKFSTDGTGDG